jgi:hypothetical protein
MSPKLTVQFDQVQELVEQLPADSQRIIMQECHTRLANHATLNRVSMLLWLTDTTIFDAEDRSNGVMQSWLDNPLIMEWSKCTYQGMPCHVSVILWRKRIRLSDDKSISGIDNDIDIPAWIEGCVKEMKGKGFRLITHMERAYSSEERSIGVERTYISSEWERKTTVLWIVLMRKNGRYYGIWHDIPLDMTRHSSRDKWNGRLCADLCHFPILRFFINLD